MNDTDEVVVTLDQRDYSLVFFSSYPNRVSPRKAKRTGYSGAELREIRKRKGVGRPPKSL